MTVSMCRTRGCPNLAADTRIIDDKPVEPGYVDFCHACVRQRRADRSAALDGKPPGEKYNLPKVPRT